VESIANEAQKIAERMTPLPLQEQEDQIGAISAQAAALLRGKRALFTEISECMRFGRDFRLDRAFIDRMVAHIPPEIAARSTSYTIIGQADDGGDERNAHAKRFVLNRIYSGHSMLMSRFLRHQGEAEIEDVANYVAELAGNSLPVEIPGVFGFNANIHPRFVGAELHLRGRRANYTMTEMIAADALTVAYDPELDRLAFFAPDGRKLSVMYFGFLNMMVLPNLYQVLGRMNLQGLILDLWQDLLFAGLLPTDKASVLPRVTYGSVVVSRRSWFLPFEHLPDPTKDEAVFYKGMHALFAQLGDRSACFVRIVPSRADFLGTGAPGDVAMADTTDFKPAYLSLDTAMTVASLQRRLRRRPRGILLQEVLPEIGSGGQVRLGRRHGCEVQFEISRNQG